MALVTGSIVNKEDIINKFKANIIDIVTSNAYSNSNIPRINGQAGTFSAVVQADLGGVNEIQNISLDSGIISGTTVYNIMIAVMKNCSRVRNFTSNLYFNTNGNNALERTITGKAVFKSTLTTVPSGYTRNKNGSLLVNPNVTNNVSGKTGSLDRLDALCNAMLAAWKSASKDQLVYNYYSCHSSCHSSCHGSRTRR